MMNEDGSNQKLLLDTGGNDFYPVWSLDGSKFTFTSDFSGTRENYVGLSDGSNIVKLIKEK